MSPDEQVSADERFVTIRLDDPISFWVLGRAALATHFDNFGGFGENAPGLPLVELAGVMSVKSVIAAVDSIGDEVVQSARSPRACSHGRDAAGRQLFRQ